MLRAARPERIDSLNGERWDVELNLLYTSTGHAEDLVLNVYEPDDDNPPRLSLTTEPGATPLPIPTTARLLHLWKDTWGVRAGGDNVILPERLAARIRPVDVHLAYVYLFQKTLHVPIGERRLNEVSEIPADFLVAVNEGRFTSHVNVLSIQGNYRLASSRGCTRSDCRS